MAAGHDLKGLMKFLDREEWQEPFDEVCEEHFGVVLAAASIEFEDLAAKRGDIANALWWCAFEDFLTRSFAVEGHNSVDEYLRRRGWKEGALTKAYVKALRSSVMSLYEVSEIVPGKSLLARDLIRGGEPVCVSDGTATRTLRQWDRIAARIVPIMGKNILSGGLLPFTPKASETLFDGLRRVFGKKNAEEIPALKDGDLRVVAALFTFSWLVGVLRKSTNSPDIRNADGDELAFHDVRFPLAAGVTQEDIASQLNAIPGMAQGTETFWNWLEDPQKSGASRPSGSLGIDTVMDSGARVLGNVELKGRFLTVSTNSAERAEQGTALIGQAFGDLVGAPLTEIRTIEQMMAEKSASKDKDSASTVPPEIAEQVAHQYLDRHYRETLDQPVGMLGNKTPRQAVMTSAGRQKVAEWLKYIENRSARQGNQGDPIATYSFEWMWQELGVLDLRR